MVKPDRFVYTAEGIELKFDYFNEEDVLFRDVQEDNHLRFVYERIILDSMIVEPLERLVNLISKTMPAMRDVYAELIY